ncbi:hypothetical protein [Phytohabitans rumicis]|nr:hypothetical protein [Phytohabitans rumicis]
MAESDLTHLPLGYPRSADPWAAQEESAMVNGFDDGWSITDIAELLRRHPAVVRARLHLFGRLPACDPMRDEEDRRIAAQWPLPTEEVPSDRVARPHEVGTPAGRGLLGRLYDRFLRMG